MVLWKFQNLQNMSIIVGYATQLIVPLSENNREQLKNKDNRNYKLLLLEHLVYIITKSLWKFEANTSIQNDFTVISIFYQLNKDFTVSTTRHQS